MSVQLDTNPGAGAAEALRLATSPPVSTTAPSLPAGPIASGAGDGAIVADWDPAIGGGTDTRAPEDKILDLLTELLEPLGQDVLDWAVERLFGDGVKGASAAPTAAPSADFESAIGSILKPDAAGEVHEEELFAAIAWERLGALATPEAAQRYLDLLGEGIAAPGASVEQAALGALKGLVDEGLIEPAVADRVLAESFAAAQLDENPEALFDGRGGPGDPTIAKASIETALAAAKAKLDAFASGAEVAPERSLASAQATGGAAPGASAGGLGDGFLFKPESDSNGRLVILLPEGLTGDVAGVVLRDREGRVIEEGDAAGVANGGREHFRFDRAGGDYPPGLSVEVTLTSGATVSRTIPDPSRRVE